MRYVVGLLALGLLVGLGLGGCAPESPPPKVGSGDSRPASRTVPADTVSRRNLQPNETIKIASFNIQVFGSSKIKKHDVMQVLAKVIRKFDVVAIQEVRSTDDTILPKFVELINADGRSYDFVIGPRLGRTSSKEQYAFVFDSTKIEVDRTSVLTVPDPDDRLHREPLTAHFRVRTPDPAQGFSFQLVNIHTDPDETKTELDALADSFVWVQQNSRGEDDVILLGDLNVDEGHLGHLGRLPGIEHAISGLPTNTRRTHTYDNLIFNRNATSEYTGRAGVLDLMLEFNLTESQALQVSDHMPVWAEFSAYEHGQPSVPARPTSFSRN